MDNLKNAQKWIGNVGDVMVSEEGHFFWMLPEVFVYYNESCVASPYFWFDQENWRLGLIPSDGYKTVLGHNYVGLFLWIRGCNILKHKYNIRLSCEDIKGRNVCCHNGKMDSRGFGVWDFLGAFGVDDISLCGQIKICCLIQRNEDNLSNLLLSVKEKENTIETVTPSDEKQKNESENKGINRLIENFRNLLNDDLSSDVILKTNDHEFRAHRLILRARSPVFYSMFQHDMTEKKTGEVDISDCSTAGFKVFLQHAYTGNADDLSPTNVLDLYYIADKYQVSDLKSDCIECTKSSLSVDNFCDVIVLSLRHGESDLKDFATQFFCRNIKKIVKTVQWQTFIIENPIQANELYIKAINA